MQRSGPILTVGSLNMDHIVQVPRLPVPGETLFSTDSLRLVPGGKGANQAVAMARLGARVQMGGRVGHDSIGEGLLTALRNDGVDDSLIIIDEQATSGVAFIFLSPHGENAIVVAPGANMHVGQDQAQMRHILAALPTAQALILQLEIPLETAIHLISASYQAQVPVVLNLAPAQPLPLETLRQLEVLVVNETEAVLISDALNGSTSQSPTPQTLDEARQLATKLCEIGIRHVVITLGSQGALLVYKNEEGQIRYVHQTPPKVQVIDTTAAGDCFTGALTVAITEGQTPAEALRFAVYASALKVTRFGAQSGLPTRLEVDTLLQSH
ncbi:ribokinase [Tengunoibacter tsumagoiensis]|uniref:Ribokinase n=1 Tax=Tengunoibacter tsumagoiensis TaxID=2014871 RepID=A0A402AA40_9CHLR|nr:ribokinase [Tengunoibacter tsumagoiensis]GCE16033.1 ribokinase [Tengunoibacter tsumagoiensis]